MSKDSITIEFVAVEKPRGRVVTADSDGSLKIVYEMLQQELDAWIEKGIEEHLNHVGNEQV